MKQPDINRVRKAQDHIKAALTVLGNIKRQNTSMREDALLREAKGAFATASFYLTYIIDIQEPK